MDLRATLRRGVELEQLNLLLFRGGAGVSGEAEVGQVRSVKQRFRRGQADGTHLRAVERVGDRLAVRHHVHLMPLTVLDVAQADRDRLSRPVGGLDKAGLIGRRIGRKCDPQAVLDARQGLAAASRTDRIDPGRVVLEDEADAIAAGVLAARQVDLE